MNKVVSIYKGFDVENFDIEKPSLAALKAFAKICTENNIDINKERKKERDDRNGGKR